MKKFIPLFIATLLFLTLQFNFSRTNGQVMDLEMTKQAHLEFYDQKPPFTDIRKLQIWISENDYKTNSSHFPIQLLFQTMYGYLYLALFATAGTFIRPRKLWIPLSIGFYLGFALLFTFI